MKRLISQIRSWLHGRASDACTPSDGNSGAAAPLSDYPISSHSAVDPLDRSFVELDDHARARLIHLIARSALAPAEIARRAAATDLPGRTRKEIDHRACRNELLLTALIDGTRTTLCPRVLNSFARELGAYLGWILTGTLLPVESRGERVRKAREARGWTQEDLARESGVSVKTIRRIELAWRGKPQTFTIDALARTLGIASDVLLTGEDVGRPAPPPPAPTKPVGDDASQVKRRSMFVAAAVTAAVLMIFVPLARHRSRSATIDPGPRITESNGGHRIDVRFGSKTWSATYPSPVKMERQLTWDGEDVLLVALSATGDGRGAVVVHRLTDGTRLLHEGPDPRDGSELLAIVGPSGFDRVLEYRDLSTVFEQRFFMDLDGDGKSELIVVSADHSGMGPARLRSFRKNGEVVINYYFDNTIDCYHVGDFDGDGKDEVIVAGTGFDGRARMAVLDDAHCRGIAPDDVAGAVRAMQDSSLASIEIPPFDRRYMDLLHQDRMHVFDCFSLRDPATDQLRIRFFTHVSRSVQVVLDGALTPIEAAPSDPFLVYARRWPEDVRNDFFEHELPAWMARFRRSGASRIDGRTPVPAHGAVRTDALARGNGDAPR
jgi:transcriptional regulator with XRE-family HTH domain